MFSLLFFFLLLVSPPPAEAGYLLGPENYYVVQKDDVDLEAAFTPGLRTPGQIETEKITLHQGQILHLDGLYNAHIAIEKIENGNIVKGEIVVPHSKIEKLFGDKLNSSSGMPDQFMAIRPTDTRRGKMIRLDASPADLMKPPFRRDATHAYVPAIQVPIQNQSGGAVVDIRESKIVDYGANGEHHFVLVHNVCLSQPRQCGWVRNDNLSRGDNLGRKTWQTVTSEAGHGAHLGGATGPACDPKDTLGKASKFASDMLAVFAQLPKDEQHAREKVEDALGKCIHGPSNTAKFNGVPGVGHKKPGTNLYDAVARAGAESAFAKIGGSASHVLVRMGDGSSRPMTKDDFVTIDAFARTLFGEMRTNSCLTKPHVAAVARTILNRSDDLDDWGKAPGPLAKNPVMKALLADQQYSVWNNDNEGGNLAKRKANTRAAWCPTEHSEEAEGWHQAVEAATHAYLDRKAFLGETDSLKGLNSYTSGRSSWSGHRPIRPPPSIYETELDDTRCMKFWHEKGE